MKIVQTYPWRNYNIIENIVNNNIYVTVNMLKSLLYTYYTNTQCWCLLFIYCSRQAATQIKL